MIHCFYFIVKINWCLTETIPAITSLYHGNSCGYTFGQSMAQKTE